VIKNCIIQNNWAESSGGGIYGVGLNLITNCIVRDNAAVKGGGIYHWFSATISNCIISGNSADDGGGIYSERGFLTISDCSILNNSGGSGGGFFAVYGSASINGCVFAGNTAEVGGGACCHGDVTFNGCTIIGNSARLGGGGIYCGTWGILTILNSTIAANSAYTGAGIEGKMAWSGISISGCRIYKNIASFAGGGIYCSGNSARIIDTVVHQNLADIGGGIYLNIDTVVHQNLADIGGGIYPNAVYSPTSIENCILSENLTARYGGGIYCENGSPTFSNCTVVDNSAGQAGGGMYCSWTHDDTRSINITDSVFDGNSAALGTEISLADYAHMMISYSNVREGMQGVSVEGDSILELGYGNIMSDPLFASGPLGDYYLSQRAAGQFVNSPCVDAGSDTAANLGLDSYTTRSDEVTDTDVVDMGYHYPTFEATDLTDIGLVFPINESIMSSPPVYVWSSDGGAQSTYVVDMATSLSGPFYVSPVIQGDAYWSMPQEWWDRIPSGSFVYWRVRGMDLDARPLNIIYSHKLWWFYKP
jgi:predicted outer membrane repeat protein